MDTLMAGLVRQGSSCHWWRHPALRKHGDISTSDQPRPPLPSFTHESALAKVQATEDAWNSRDPERVASAYSADTEWRNCEQHLRGCAEVVAFLTDKWDHELGYIRRREASINDVVIDESDLRLTPSEGELHVW